MSGIVGEGLATRTGGGEGGGHRKRVLGREGEVVGGEILKISRVSAVVKMN